MIYVERDEHFIIQLERGTGEIKKMTQYASKTNMLYRNERFFFVDTDDTFGSKTTVPDDVYEWLKDVPRTDDGQYLFLLLWARVCFTNPRTLERENDVLTLEFHFYHKEHAMLFKLAFG